MGRLNVIEKQLEEGALGREDEVALRQEEQQLGASARLYQSLVSLREELADCEALEADEGQEAEMRELAGQEKDAVSASLPF